MKLRRLESELLPLQSQITQRAEHPADRFPMPLPQLGGRIAGRRKPSLPQCGHDVGAGDVGVIILLWGLEGMPGKREEPGHLQL